MGQMYIFKGARWLLVDLWVVLWVVLRYTVFIRKLHMSLLYFLQNSMDVHVNVGLGIAHFFGMPTVKQYQYLIIVFDIFQLFYSKNRD